MLELTTVVKQKFAALNSLLLKTHPQKFHDLTDCKSETVVRFIVMMSWHPCMLLIPTDAWNKERNVTWGPSKVHRKIDLAEEHRNQDVVC